MNKIFVWLLILALAFAIPFHALGAMTTDGVPDYCANLDSTTPVPGNTFTQSCWFSSTTVTAAQSFYFFQRKEVGQNYAGLGIASSKMESYTADGLGTFATINVNVALSNNTWYHGCHRQVASNDRSTYLNGANKTNNTTNIAIQNTAAANRTVIGAFYVNPTPIDSFRGTLHSGATWHGALTDEDIAGLAAGRSPLTMGRDTLRFYCPLEGNHTSEYDIVGQQTLAFSGASKAERPLMRYGGRRY